VGVRKDIDIKYKYPKPHNKIYNLIDALKKGELFDSNVPKSEGSKYPEHKKAVLDLVPQKGYWRNLPVEIQKEYMGKSFYLGGGKTGIARRIGWDEPCLTLTCSPAKSKQKDVIQKKLDLLQFVSMQESKHFLMNGNLLVQFLNNTNKSEMLFLVI
jgi:hypothetical protein